MKGNIITGTGLICPWKIYEITESFKHGGYYSTRSDTTTYHIHTTVYTWSVCLLVTSERKNSHGKEMKT